MKSLRYSLSFILLLLAATASYAQVAGSVSQSALGATAAAHSRTSAALPLAPQLPSPTAEELHLTHFDNTTPTIPIAVPATISPYAILILGERFVLPQDSGFVDSVTFVVDTAVGDSINVVIFPDTLYEVSPGSFFHLMNLWTGLDIADAVTPIIANGEGRTIHHVPFPHVPVSKNFWVMITPHITDGTYSSALTLEGDRGPVVTRTADNTFSGFVANANGGEYSLIFDGTFYDVNHTIIYSNFNITAHVSAEPSAVATGVDVPALRVYPNPTTDVLNISGVTPDAKSEIVDALGRIVARVDGTSVSVRDLAPGAYTLRTKTGARISAEKFVVSR